MGDDYDRRKRSKWDDRGSGRESAERSSGRSRWDERRDDRRDREDRRDRDDRRSRSPRGRSRSPPPARTSEAPSEGRKSSVDPAAAAAAAAAKINAQIQAKRGVQHVDVPPILSSLSGGASTSPGPTGKSGSPPTTGFNSEMYIADGDYIKDIEVNDLRNRYTLTKGATQKMIKEETGADVTTRGAYYPDKSLATPQNPPLYLHVTSTTKEGLEKAVARIEELMKQELPQLVDERRFRRREPPEPVERDEYGRRKWPEEKIPVGLDPIPGFNLRASVVGHQGSYVKHIQQETGCRVQIKGKGSGFRDHNTDAEDDEPLYLHVKGSQPQDVQRAKEMCEDLVATVRKQYEEHKNAPQGPRYGGYQGGGGGYGGHGGHHGGHSASPPPQQQQGSRDNSVTPATPVTPATAADPNAAAQAQAAAYNPYAAYYGGADPYAAYGGYAAYMQYYQQYYGAAAAAAAPGTTAAAPGAPGTAPPGPPGASNYSAVKPPPGL